jgi:hypothetical protein
MVQVVECLPIKCKALSPTPSTVKILKRAYKFKHYKIIFSFNTEMHRY